MARTKRTKTPPMTPEEKRRQRRVMAFSLFMALLMVASVASVIQYNPAADTQMTYGDYEFAIAQRADGVSVLVTEIEGQEVEFQNLPVQVSYLEVDPAAITMLRDAQQVALVADPSLAPQDAALVDYARLQLSLAIPKSVVGMTQADPRRTLPVLNCTHASAQMPVVLFDANASAAITTQDYCITLGGAQQDVLRLKDRLIFEYHGILRGGEVVDD